MNDERKEDEVIKSEEDSKEDGVIESEDIEKNESEKIEEKEKSDIAAAYLDLLSTFV